MEKIFWFVAAFGAATFIISCVMTIVEIRFKRVKSFFRSAGMALIICGWAGLASLPEYDFFHLPFYPLLFLYVMGYAIAGSAIALYVGRNTN